MTKKDKEKIVTVRSDEKTGRDIGLLIFVTDDEWRMLDELKQNTGLSIDEIYARGLRLVKTIHNTNQLYDIIMHENERIRKLEEEETL